MSSIWIIAAGAIAVVATALTLRRGRRSHDQQSSAVGPVSEEWLSNARGQADQSW
jgi:hypothetical protein